MFHIKAQFFFCFHVFGSVMPFFAVYLKSKGLDEADIGWLFGVGGLAIIVTPVLTTLLADTRLSAKNLLVVAYLTAAAAMLGFLVSDSQYQYLPMWQCLILMFVFQLAIVCMPPLQDGLQFQYEDEMKRQKLPSIPYHQVRVWGTVGFISPSLILYFPLKGNTDLSPILWVAIGSSLLGALNSFFLPVYKPSHQLNESEPSITGSMEPASESPALAQEHHPGKSMPTLEAAKVILSPPILLFCTCMMLVQMVSGTYYTFYPVYLNEIVGLNSEWLGLIAVSGVVVEIIYMLSFGWMKTRLGGLKGILLIGVGCIMLRMYLLSTFSSASIGIGIQVMHGLTVIATHMIGPLYLNEVSSPRFRHSIQGLFVMVVLGLGRLFGNILSGQIAAPDVENGPPHIQKTFLVMTLLTFIAFTGFIWMKRIKPDKKSNG